PGASVGRLEFVSTGGDGDGPGARERLGLTGKGVTAVITDLGILEPDPETRELTLTVLHPGVTADAVKLATGWPLRVAEEVRVGDPPSTPELRSLRALAATDARDGDGCA